MSAWLCCLFVIFFFSPFESGRLIGNLFCLAPPSDDRTAAITRLLRGAGEARWTGPNQRQREGSFGPETTQAGGNTSSKPHESKFGLKWKAVFILPWGKPRLWTKRRWSVATLSPFCRRIPLPTPNLHQLFLSYKFNQKRCQWSCFAPHFTYICMCVCIDR